MSDDLRIPVDFERSHEFRLLVSTLKKRAAVQAEKSIEACAVFIYLRLFVDLAFLARTTDRPGYLTKSGALLFQSSLDPMFGDECDPLEILKEALLLEVPQSAAAAEEGDLYCPVFAKLNRHFASNFMTKEKLGNVTSLYERQKRLVAHRAQQLALLLPAQTFHKRDEQKTLMDENEIKRAMALIITLDNALGNPPRTTAQFTESLVADAYTVSAKYAREQEILRDVYVWIMNNRTHPALPKAVEKILPEFETIEKLATR